MNYMVSSQEKPHNYPIYYVHTNLDSFILYNDGITYSQISQVENDPTENNDIQTQTEQLDHAHEPLWNMIFDGSCGQAGSGEGICVYNIGDNSAQGHSYKLIFQCTNNIVEYEALMLGLKMLKILGARRIFVQGDSELVIKQVKGLYSAKQPRLRAYRYVVLDFFRTFEEYDVAAIPRNQNFLANDLAILARTCVSL